MNSFREIQVGRGLLLLVGMAGGFLLPLLACGPFFPNSLLVDGDHAVLQAPAVSFRRELDRLQLPAPPKLVNVPAEGETPRSTTVDAELSDLRRALFGAGRSVEEVAAVALAYSGRRADLEEHVETVRRWTWEKENTGQLREGAGEPAERPRLTLGEMPPGVPREFASYLEGAAAWHDGRVEAARAAWESVLALPPAERRYKSVWAAFMLGRSWHDGDPAKAGGYYEQAVRLARAQFADSAGLAVGALGWQAQLRLRTNDFKGALSLYLDQYAAGSTQSASLSLSVAARAVAVRANAEQRREIARDPVFRRVVTAWLLADDQWVATWDDDARSGARKHHRPWLESLEEVGAAEVPLAEQLAVLAYQTGDWEGAQRWVDLSGDSPVGAWIRAKLLLRDGKLDEAARTLAEVVAELPLDPGEPPRGQAPPFVESLYAPDSDFDDIPGRRQALGELGVLRLTRGEFVQALDALLRAGFWQDAAYVAERVLTVGELRDYVDRSWEEAKGGAAPAPTRTAEGDDATASGAVREGDASPHTQREKIRYLLARRLTRLHRGGEANPYYPPAWRPAQTRFLELLRGGEDVGRPSRERSASWMAAAWMARTNGLELLGTELAPDGAIWDGQFEAIPDADQRGGSEAKWLKATTAELDRARSHGPDPDERFHYRYQAAALAWEVAKLLPDNDPETALALYHGGNWLKARDPKTADVFYKALVRRCRKTELGDAADRQRWFPAFDEQGHPVVTRVAKAAPTPVVVPEPTEPGPEPAAEDDSATAPEPEVPAEAEPRIE